MTKTPEAIEMFVGGLVLDPNTQAPVVVLKDESGQVTLPIWIGVAEATSIASALKQVPITRPLTHDLMMDIIGELGARVERVMITELKDSTYYAELLLGVGEKAFVLDSRPSDAIGIAVRAQAPIYVSQQVIEQAQVRFSVTPVTQEGEQQPQNATETEAVEETGEKDLQSIDPDKWSDILASLDPDDFKYKQ